MLRFSRLNDTLSRSCVLGALGLLINLIGDITLQASFLHPGNIFVFMAAAVFGVQGGLIAAFVAGIPETLLTGDSLCLRIVPIAAAIGIVADRNTKLPGYLVSLLAWTLLIWLPLIVLFPQAQVPIGARVVTGSYLSLATLSDVLFTLVSGCLLLNGAVWNVIARRPRKVLISDLLLHVIPLISTLFIFLTLMVIESSALSLFDDANSWNVHALTALAVIGILIPSLLAHRLSAVIISRFREYTTPGLSVGAQTFSGLSSDFWRRKIATSEQPLRITGSGLLTDGALEIPNPSKLNDPEQGICAVNRNGTISFVNRKFKSFCGTRLNDVIGRRLQTLNVPPAILKHLENIIELTFTQGAQSTELKLNELPKPLRFFEIATLKSESFENSSVASGPDGIIITVKDITERRTVEAHLLQGQKLDSLGSFVGGMAHSFNNALTAIAANASFARIINTGEKTHRATINDSLTRVIESAQQAGALIHELLDFAEGRPGLVKEVEFGSLIEDRVDLIRRAVGDTTEIIVSKPSKKLGSIADKTLVTQALTNLVFNATESYPDGQGRIEIGLESEEFEKDFSFLPIGAKAGKYVRVKIRDYGMGMNTETLGKAFEPLFTTKRTKGHTGLGLSIVYAIVRAHNGFVTVETAPAKGTTFSLYFPETPLSFKDDSDQKPKNYCTLELPDLPQGRSESILVVEDDDIVRPLVVKMLESLGYQPEGCCNGLEAIEMCKSKIFDLAIIDMVMPKLNGAGLILQLQDVSPDTKILVMTGHGTLAQQTTPENTALIVKPFEIESLAEKVSLVLHPIQPKSEVGVHAFI